MTETDEIRLVTSTILQIDAEINNLYHRRCRLVTELNTLRSATRRVPPEILTEIFRLSACKTNLREPEQLYYINLAVILKIGSVCVQWRRVAWAASNLWTTCLLSPPSPPLAKSRVDSETRSHITSLVLANCRTNNNISVRVDLDDDSRSPRQLEVLLNQYPAHLRALRVRLANELKIGIWNRYFGTLSQVLPNLRELWVSWPYSGISGPVFQSSSPSLDLPEEVRPDAAAQRPKCVPWRIPMNQLAILRLSNIPIDQCVHLLLHCSNLVEFHCMHPSPPSGIYHIADLLPVPERPKSLHSIKRFRWRVYDLEWNGFLFSSIRFPNLERLFSGCYTTSDPDPPSPVDHIFYQSFMPSLHHIRALDLEPFLPMHTHFGRMVEYTKFESLEQLYFVVSTKNSDFISWFNLLTLKPSMTTLLLPKLKTLHVDIRSLKISKARSFGALHRFLTSRRQRNASCTQLERIIIETCEVPLQLTQVQTEVLSKFVAEGLTLEVVPCE